MSTTFVVRNRGDETIVARRCNGMRWTNGLASLLSDETKVIPIDNSAQGIHTIGDIKKQIKAQK